MSKLPNFVLHVMQNWGALSAGCVSPHTWLVLRLLYIFLLYFGRLDGSFEYSATVSSLA